MAIKLTRTADDGLNIEISAETIKALAAGGEIIDTGIPVGEAPAQPVVDRVLDNDAQYLVTIKGGTGGSNPAKGDNELAQVVSDAIFDGGADTVAVLTSDGTQPVDYRKQLAGKPVGLAVLVPRGDDDQAVLSAGTRVKQDFGAVDQSFSVDVDAVSGAKQIFSFGQGRIVHCHFTCS